ncbi:hypothetical protein [Paracoccus seriniphilus]|uniref:AAA+ family ATPase n=1 Tax=Paracoccus seriniphilus TaxID=184748 RepID=A0A239PRU1_9RHOB|nr:hypothetical protein [Paracoccus seriniphilus]WCR12951.1 hypothetical protein JHW44_08270 [Paracoccus seriniphilus]SNT72616.1 hypothetical protein SAMN05444959_103114 [Paracoccus seriniphilus]
MKPIACAIACAHPDRMMKRQILATLLILSTTLPVLGQDMPDDRNDPIGRALEGFMRNFIEDISPDLNRLGEDMSGGLSRMAPVLEDLSVLVDDLENYQMPQRLENGDIIIRRRPGAPPPPPLGDSLQDMVPPEAPPTVPINPDAPEIAL